MYVFDESCCCQHVLAVRAGFALPCLAAPKQLGSGPPWDMLFSYLSFPLAQLIAEHLAALSWPWPQLYVGSALCHYAAVATGFISSAVLSLLLLHISLPDLPARLFFCPDGCLAHAI